MQHIQTTLSKGSDLKRYREMGQLLAGRIASTRADIERMMTSKRKTLTW